MADFVENFGAGARERREKRGSEVPSALLALFFLLCVPDSFFLTPIETHPLEAREEILLNRVARRRASKGLTF